MHRTTFWLWYGTQLVTSVRADSGTSENEIRRRAMAMHESIPLVDGLETPYERACKIRNSRIVTYPGGN